MTNQQAPESLPDPSPDQLRAIARTARNSSGSASDDCGPLAYVLRGWRAAAIAFRAQQAALVEAQQPAPSAAAVEAVVVYEQKENEMQVWFRPARMHGHPERTPIKATITKDRGNGIVDLTYDDGEFSGNARAVPNALRLPRNVREQVAVWWDVGFEMDFQTAVDNSLKKKKDDPPPQPSPTPQADSAPLAAPADIVVLEAALRAIHQAIDLIGEPDTERLRTVRRVLRGAVVVAEDSNAPQADSQPAVQQWNDLIGKETHADADGLLVWRDEVDFAIPTPQADSQPALDPADVIAGALQISRGHAISLMQQAVDADRAARAQAESVPAVDEDGERYRYLIETLDDQPHGKPTIGAAWDDDIGFWTKGSFFGLKDKASIDAAIDADRKQGDAE